MNRVISVLLVEDEERIRKGIRKLLEEYVGGFRVIAEGSNGKVGLELFEQFSPDIIIADVRMPRMDGLEMLQRIRSKGQDVLAIILSGHDEFEYVRRALRSNVVDYLLKPIDHAEFAMALQKAKTLLGTSDADSNSEPTHEAAEGSERHIIRRVKELVQINLHKDFTLQDAADEVRLNYNYLSSLFKEKTGMSFSDYVTEARIEKARNLLKNSHLKSYEISRLCGYSNSKYFITVFKKSTGKTPSEYRECQ